MAWAVHSVKDRGVVKRASATCDGPSFQREKTPGIAHMAYLIGGAGATPVFLVLARMADLEDAVLSLSRVGVDNLAGVLVGGFNTWRDAGLPVAHGGVITPRELEQRGESVRVLDVRDDSEFENEGHIPDAAHLYVGYLEKHLRAIEPPLETTEHVAVTCNVGHRASLAASVLRRQGFEYVDKVLGGMTAWNKLELPTDNGQGHTVTTPDIEGERT